MTRIAVLGAGLIGGVLARELAREGEFEVSVFDADPDALSRLAVQAPVSVERADLSRPDEIAAAVADADGVVGALPGRPGAGHITVFSNRTPGPTSGPNARSVANMYTQLHHLSRQPDGYPPIFVDP